MRFETNNVEQFKTVMGMINDFVNEVTIRAKPDGLTVVAMDPASVAMIVVDFDKSFFAELESEKEEKLTFGTGLMQQILKKSIKEQFEFETEKDRAFVRTTGAKKKTFSLPILESSESEPKMQTFEFNAAYELKTKDLKMFLEDAMICAESITFESKKGKLSFHSEGDSESYDAQAEDVSPVKEGSARSRYSIEYLSKAVRELDEKVTVSFSKEYPIRIDQKIPGVSVSVIIAPRVDD